MPLLNNYFKARRLRAPLAPQTTFAYEQMIDELAYAANMDPVEFRLKNIATVDKPTPDAAPAVAERARRTSAKISNWQPQVAASKLSNANVVTGRGIALGGYVELDGRRSSSRSR